MYQGEINKGLVHAEFYFDLQRRLMVFAHLNLMKIEKSYIKSLSATSDKL